MSNQFDPDGLFSSVADSNLPAVAPVAHEPGHPNMPALTLDQIETGVEAFYRKQGRPTMLTVEMACEIAGRLAAGETLLSISQGDNMPAYGTLFRWQRENEGFSQAIAQARVAWSHAQAEEARQLLDNVDGTAKDNQVRKAQAQAELRLRLAEKYNWHEFGTKQQQLNINANVEISPVDLSSYLNRR